MSLANLSDEELEKMIQKKSAAPKGFAISNLPDEDLDKLIRQKASKPSMFESAARGGGQGLTFGYSDEGMGLLKSVMHGLKNAKFDPNANIYSAEGMEKQKELRSVYENERDLERTKNEAAQEANPLTYGGFDIAGSIVSPVSKVGKGLSLAKQGLLLGAAAGSGYSEGENSGEVLKDTGTGALLGGLLGKGGELIGKPLKKSAEKLAVNATGATGKQASEFADDAGRQLLDRKLVRFWDNPNKIAQRTAGAMDNANSQIDDALKSLDAKGGGIDSQVIKDSLSKKISEMRTNPSKADIAKLIEAEVQNLESSVAAKGSGRFSLSEAEDIKRGYSRKAGNWLDQEKGQAGKQTYLTYRDAVEEAAQKVDPATAGVFEEGKKTYGLLAPIQEAAERRALQQNQSPIGGLLDVATATAGAVKGDPLMTVASPIARRVVAPRISSSLAVSFDAVAKQLIKTPEGAALAKKDPQAFKALVINLSKPATENLGRVADQEK